MKNLIYKIVLILILGLFPCLSFCQTESKLDFNSGFEKLSRKGQLPDSWLNWSTIGYRLKTDSTEKHSEKYSMLIELIGDKPENSFGCCTYSIPAICEGSQIELRAYMKLQNVENGQIGLMLRIDGERGKLQFDNMKQKNIQGSSDWTLYSVKLPLPEEAKVFYIGAMLFGSGKLWVDDFQLLIDGKDIGNIKPKIQKLLKADKDTEFDTGSNIPTINLTLSKTEDLAILGKIWGFLKYYHPTISTGDYNWDYELFRIMPKIIRSETNEKRNEILLDWILGFGEVEKEMTTKIEDYKIKLKPDLNWITNCSMLGEELTRQLLLIRDAKRSYNHYYIKYIPPAGNPLFTNEKPYSNDIPNFDVGYRLLSLFRYWNIIQYFFPYKNLIDEDWSTVLLEFIPKFVNSTGELDYKLTILNLISFIHDSHANIMGTNEVLETYKGNNYAPIEVKFIENKVVVTNYLNRLYGEKTGLQKGDIIISINNKTINEIIDNKLPITPASNYPTQLHNIAEDLLRTNDTILNITYRRNNTIFSSNIRCFNADEIYLHENSRKRDTCFKLLTQDIAYLYVGSIKNAYLPKIMAIVKSARGLIVDLRCYPSDIIVFSLSEYLIPKATNFVTFSKTSTINPGLFTFFTTLKVGKLNQDYYKGKVIILVNETTFSQAEYTAMALRLAPGAVVIGSTTAGADGNVSSFLLPGLIKTSISGEGVYYPDGKETQRVGIIPDIEVKPTIKGIVEGRDELVEKSIEIINNNR